MYVCMYVRMYGRIYVCMYDVCMYICMYDYVYVTIVYIICVWASSLYLTKVLIAQFKLFVINPEQSTAKWKLAVEIFAASIQV